MCGYDPHTDVFLQWSEKISVLSHLRRAVVPTEQDAPQGKLQHAVDFEKRIIETNTV